VDAGRQCGFGRVPVLLRLFVGIRHIRLRPVRRCGRLFVRCGCVG
jgi:hypothetical protein